MRITSTDTYLSLILGALETTLVPELSSSGAKATADIVKNMLVELQKREQDTPQLLDHHIAAGQAIAAGMLALLAELGNAPATAASVTAPDAGGTFPPLSSAHGQLTAQLARLAAALVAQRGRGADAANTQRISALLRQAADWETAYYARQRAATVASPLAAKAEKRGGPLTRELLQDFLRARHPGGERCTVSAFEPIPGGFGKQTFRVTLGHDNGKHETLIVRKSSPTPMVAHGGFLIEREFHLLKSVHGSGLPVAEPLYLATDLPELDGDFYVMTALPGTVPGTYLGGATAEIPEAVVLHLAELLAKLHGLKLETLSAYLARYEGNALHETVESCYRRQIAEWKAYHARIEHLPSPFIVYLFDWLETHVPRKSNPPVLVHGDFNIHNVLAADGRITGILDWECAMLGTPEQDLSWIKPHISKCIDWERFVSHYRACGGPEIDEEVMGFCLAFSSLRVSVGPNKGLLNLQQGIDRDIRYIMVELAFAHEFMNLGLVSSSR